MSDNIQNNSNCYGCYGCNGCYGCLNVFGGKECEAIKYAIFPYKDECRKYVIFKTQVSEERYIKIKSELDNKLNGWYPKQTNTFELYTKSGNDWTKINISDLICKEWNNSWQDMPKEAIEYLQSLEEFDAKIFKKITGIDIDDEVSKVIKLLKDKGKIKDGKIIDC